LARLLYLEASPRHENSYSSRVAAAFLETYRSVNPDDEIDHFHLFDHAVPEFDEEAARQKMEHIARLIKEGKGIEPHGKWAEVLHEIDRLKAADKVLISSPMWNYSIPYRLKQYLDVVVQPGLTFGVNRKGEYVGMLRNKRMQLILASGSRYAQRFPQPEDGPKTDFQRAYLEHMGRYIGIQDIRTIKIEPTEAEGSEVADQLLQERIREAQEAAKIF